MKRYLSVLLVLTLSGCVGSQTGQEALETPQIHKAVGAGDITAVQHLIDEGVDVNAKTPLVGETPLFWAAVGCNLEEVPIQNTEPEGNNPCQGGSEIHADIVELLVANGADVNITADMGGGYTPLHAAVLNNSLPVASALIEAGADVNFKTKDGTGATPLKVAKGMQHSKIALLLEQHGGKE